MSKEIEMSALMPCDSEFLYRWHTMPRAIHRLTPPWEQVDILEHPVKLRNNEFVRIKLDGIFDWKLKVFDVEEGKTFSDTQVSGPFASWKHKHLMQPINESSSLLVERISYKLPVLDFLLNDLVTKFKLKRAFDYRFRTMFHDIKLHYKYRDTEPLKILISGSSGLVGSSLYDFLKSGGHNVFRLVRNQTSAQDEIYWDPENNQIDKSKLEGFDVVIHLAGENIASKRWTNSQKQKIAASRIHGTTTIAEALKHLKQAPRVFLSASAIGFYGDRPQEICNETSSIGNGFLADTCKQWEDASKSLQEIGTRVVHARFGIILDPRAGALAKILPIFALGGGGNLGNGKQWMSWIALDDVLGGLLHCINDSRITGAVNFTSPNQVQNKEFTRVLASVLKRPAFLPAPATALRLALGEMAEALLLSSTRVAPQILEDTGYEFAYPNLRQALKHMLGK